MKREVFEKRFKKQRAAKFRGAIVMNESICYSMAPDMGLAPGGRMRQQIYDDPYKASDWQVTTSSRCFVHLCNSLVWQSITGDTPPHPAPTAKSYTEAGLPWFDYYDDSQSAVPGTPTLAGLKSVAQVAIEKGDVALPENESVTPEHVVAIRQGLRREQVREGRF